MIFLAMSHVQSYVVSNSAHNFYENLITSQKQNCEELLEL